MAVSASVSAACCLGLSLGGSVKGNGFGYYSDVLMR